jgi:hypothetical protein
MDWKEVIARDIQLLDQGFDKYREKGLKWSEQDTTDLPFKNLCVEIMNGVGKEYHQLKIGVHKSPEFAAWAARNLLELRIITSYILKSKTNADRFMNDMWPDGVELFEALERQQARTTKQLGIEHDPKLLQQTIDNMQKQKEAFGLKVKERHLDIKELAIETGNLDEYSDVNRICSKLVHRTAFSLLAFENKGEMGQIPFILFHFGTIYAMQVWADLGTHIEKHGMQPVK